ncbi:MAG: S41 family peptidase [Solirubrobacteraceae bacterium]|nr:S41 family peptidase [Solirubrobacteraceae bacterium]
MLRRLLAPVICLILALAAGIWLGGHPDRLPGPVRDALIQKDLAIVGEGLGVLDRRYYREPDQRAVADAALKSAVESLGDQYSAYLSPKDLIRFNEVTGAKFEGIGVEIQKVAKGLKIVRVYDGSPAKQAELKPDDVIVQAANKPLAGLSSQAASALIRGPKGTKVKLELQRGDETITKDVGRDEVRIPIVASRYDAKEKVGIVRLASFSEGAHGQIAVAIDALRKKGAQGIVLDLRSNPGGLVEEAVRTSGLFLKGGTVVTTKGRAVRERTLKAGDDPKYPNLPLVVLVDESSASASEIVTGALQDRGRAKVYGTRTYGKGVFQEIIELSSGGAMDITVGQYFTPKGRNLGGAGVTKGKDVSRGKGLAPDVSAVDDPKTPKVDEAAEKAMEAVAAQVAAKRP